MKLKHYLLLFIIPLSEIKSIFYDSDLKVDWYLFNDNKRYLCNVLEDYSNVVIFGIVFYYLAFLRIDLKCRNIAVFLFVLNCLDLIHLSLIDMQYFIIIKLLLTLLICKFLKRFTTIL
jgi:hypothetical protein